ncbi:TetR family transcriptional regulator [Paraburkholderia sp. BL23I1N1]|uniref:TetR/AcrR family transcriptional regulator n=1 Tax=Paraburkholderia sp. BL23I1N1 TaxID=1938802 RepID=UPI000E72C2C1|nr:TetR/AcrR family transcriptional regulator [Paraburkholderia sp. BL23I1N1]RKE36452.1 TetR family transcriptional regulator [Paraburkholderia sp. BL23I1N1]
MSKRIPGSGSLSRAKTPEDKAQVRRAFINAGRRLLAQEHPSQVSLRRIAAEAGYSPASIYQYFNDHRALFVAVRENDLTAAAEYFEKVASGATDPIERVRQVAIRSVDYWLSRPEQFDFLFSMVGKSPGTAEDGDMRFGESPVVLRALNVYYHAVDALFDTLAEPPLPNRLAGDTLIAAIYGVVLVPRTTPTKRWSDTYKMVELTVNAIIDSWLASGVHNGNAEVRSPAKRKPR